MHYPVNVFVGKVRDYDGSRPSAIGKIQVDGELTLGELGLEGDEQADLRYHGGCNFAILLPAWDILFGTLYHEKELPPTGIHEINNEEISARDNFWAQQKLGLTLFWKALVTRPEKSPSA